MLNFPKPKPKTGRDSFEQAADAREKIAQKLQGQGAARPAAPAGSPAPALPEKAELKDRVLHAAGELFRTRGLTGVQFAEIAERAQVPPAKVFELAMDPEELLYQVLVQEVTRFVTAADPLVDPEVPVHQLMASLSEFSFGYIEQNELLLQLMLGVVDDALPAWNERLHLLRQRCHGVIVRVLKIGIQQKVLRASIVPELVAAVLFELHISGYLLHYRPGADRKLRAEQRRIAALDMIFRGLDVRPDEDKQR